MTPQDHSHDHAFLFWCLRQPEVCPRKLAARCPNFLIISPPKTGSTWLADNLRCHPALYVPPIKEVKYFSCFMQWLDLNWYLDHFTEGEGRVRGEASPSYAILPVDRIRLIRRLLPDVKLIYLMRDPVSRAWSHARHNHRHREVTFADGTLPLDQVSDEQWEENFRHEWALASGDYLGQLRRWLSVFPRDQVFVDFYERIETGPEALLRAVFAFLGVEADVNLDGLPVRDRILEGPTCELRPSLEGVLQGLFHERTRELGDFLAQELGLRLPPGWGWAMRPQAGRGAEFENLDIDQVVRLEESFPSAGRGVRAGHRGYEIVCYQGQLYAVDQALGAVRIADLDEATLRRYREAGRCFVAPSLGEVTRQVDEYVFWLAGERRRYLEQRQVELARDLRETKERLARLEVGVGEVIDALHQAQAELARVSSLRYWANRAWRSARRLTGR